MSTERRKKKDTSLTWFFACYIVVRNDQDIEGQVSKTDGDDSGQKRRTKKTIIDPEGRLLLWWNIMFAVSCAIAVSVDPLFYYLPLINTDKKCVWLDKRLKIVAITLRSVTDFIYLLNIILQFICPYIDEASRKLGRTEVVTDPRQIAKRYFFSRYFVIDVLAILPLPQVRGGTFLLLNCFACMYIAYIDISYVRTLIGYNLSRFYLQIIFFRKWEVQEFWTKGSSWTLLFSSNMHQEFSVSTYHGWILPGLPANLLDLFGLKLHSISFSISWPAT